MTPRSLYIHVPFCARRCFYCDFAVEATRRPPVDDWLSAVSTELALTASEQAWNEPLRLDTLYVGGGTPSLLGEGVMQRLLAAVGSHVELADDAEWTCEANPESFTPILAEDWREAGVNRLSLGVQSFDSTVLRWMGRLHGPSGAVEACADARRAGFTEISVDLIFGLPDHLRRDWSDDLDQALRLEPDHVSLYGLTAEAGAPLGRRVREGTETLAGEERYAEEYLLANERLTAEGFEHYEVSNFARPGARSRHNSAYWTGAPYAALGPGAHAFHPPHRRWNLRSWAAYRDAVAAGRLPIDGEERIEADEEALEAIWLGLRTDAGLPLSRLAAGERSRIAEWERRGLATIREDRLVLSPQGWLILDELAVELSGARYLPSHERGAGATGPTGAAAGYAGDPDEAAAENSGRIDARAPLVQISAHSKP